MALRFNLGLRSTPRYLPAWISFSGPASVMLLIVLSSTVPTVAFPVLSPPQGLFTHPELMKSQRITKRSQPFLAEPIVKYVLSGQNLTLFCNISGTSHNDCGSFDKNEAISKPRNTNFSLNQTSNSNGVSFNAKSDKIRDQNQNISWLLPNGRVTFPNYTKECINNNGDTRNGVAKNITGTTEAPILRADWTITDAKMADTGSYICKNELSLNLAVYDVIVVAPPPAPYQCHVVQKRVEPVLSGDLIIVCSSEFIDPAHFKFILVGLTSSQKKPEEESGSMTKNPSQASNVDNNNSNSSKESNNIIPIMVVLAGVAVAAAVVVVLLLLLWRKKRRGCHSAAEQDSEDLSLSPNTDGTNTQAGTTNPVGPLADKQEELNSPDNLHSSSVVANDKAAVDSCHGEPKISGDPSPYINMTLKQVRNNTEAFVPSDLQVPHHGGKPHKKGNNSGNNNLKINKESKNQEREKSKNLSGEERNMIFKSAHLHYQQVSDVANEEQDGSFQDKFYPGYDKLPFHCNTDGNSTRKDVVELHSHFIPTSSKPHNESQTDNILEDIEQVANQEKYCSTYQTLSLQPTTVKDPTHKDENSTQGKSHLKSEQDSHPKNSAHVDGKDTVVSDYQGPSPKAQSLLNPQYRPTCDSHTMHDSKPSNSYPSSSPFQSRQETPKTKISHTDPDNQNPMLTKQSLNYLQQSPSGDSGTITKHKATPKLSTAGPTERSRLLQHTSHSLYKTEPKSGVYASYTPGKVPFISSRESAFTRTKQRWSLAPSNTVDQSKRNVYADSNDCRMVSQRSLSASTVDDEDWLRKWVWLKTLPNVECESDDTATDISSIPFIDDVNPEKSSLSNLSSSACERNVKQESEASLHGNSPTYFRPIQNDKERMESHATNEEKFIIEPKLSSKSDYYKVPSSRPKFIEKLDQRENEAKISSKNDDETSVQEKDNSSPRISKNSSDKNEAREVIGTRDKETKTINKQNIANGPNFERLENRGATVNTVRDDEGSHASISRNEFKEPTTPYPQSYDIHGSQKDFRNRGVDVSNSVISDSHFLPLRSEAPNSVSGLFPASSFEDLRLPNSADDDVSWEFRAQTFSISQPDLNLPPKLKKKTKAQSELAKTMTTLNKPARKYNDYDFPRRMCRDNLETKDFQIETKCKEEDEKADTLDNKDYINRGRDSGMEIQNKLSSFHSEISIPLSSTPNAVFEEKEHMNTLLPISHQEDETNTSPEINLLQIENKGEKVEKSIEESELLKSPHYFLMHDREEKDFAPKSLPKTPGSEEEEVVIPVKKTHSERPSKSIDNVKTHEMRAPQSDSMKASSNSNADILRIKNDNSSAITSQRHREELEKPLPTPRPRKTSLKKRENEGNVKENKEITRNDFLDEAQPREQVNQSFDEDNRITQRFELRVSVDVTEKNSLEKISPPSAEETATSSLKEKTSKKSNSLEISRESHYKEDTNFPDDERTPQRRETSQDEEVQNFSSFERSNSEPLSKETSLEERPLSGEEKPIKGSSWISKNRKLRSRKKSPDEEFKLESFGRRQNRRSSSKHESSDQESTEDSPRERTIRIPRSRKFSQDRDSKNNLSDWKRKNKPYYSREDSPHEENRKDSTNRKRSSRSFSRELFPDEEKEKISSGRKRRDRRASSEEKSSNEEPEYDSPGRTRFRGPISRVEPPNEDRRKDSLGRGSKKSPPSRDRSPNEEPKRKSSGSKKSRRPPSQTSADEETRKDSSDKRRRREQLPKNKLLDEEDDAVSRRLAQSKDESTGEKPRKNSFWRRSNTKLCVWGQSSDEEPNKKSAIKKTHKTPRLRNASLDTDHQKYFSDRRSDKIAYSKDGSPVEKPRNDPRKDTKYGKTHSREESSYEDLRDDFLGSKSTRKPLVNEPSLNEKPKEHSLVKGRNRSLQSSDLSPKAKELDQVPRKTSSSKEIPLFEAAGQYSHGKRTSKLSLTGEISSDEERQIHTHSQRANRTEACPVETQKTSAHDEATNKTRRWRKTSISESGKYTDSQRPNRKLSSREKPTNEESRIQSPAERNNDAPHSLELIRDKESKKYSSDNKRRRRSNACEGPSDEERVVGTEYDEVSNTVSLKETSSNDESQKCFYRQRTKRLPYPKEKSSERKPKDSLNSMKITLDKDHRNFSSTDLKADANIFPKVDRSIEEKQPMTNYLDEDNMALKDIDALSGEEPKIYPKCTDTYGRIPKNKENIFSSGYRPESASSDKERDKYFPNDAPKRNILLRRTYSESNVSEANSDEEPKPPNPLHNINRGDSRTRPFPDEETGEHLPCVLNKVPHSAEIDPLRKEVPADKEPGTDSLRRKEIIVKIPRTEYPKREATNDTVTRTTSPRNEATKDKDLRTESHERELAKDKEQRTDCPRREATTHWESRRESPRRKSISDKIPVINAPRSEPPKDKDPITDSPRRETTPEKASRTSSLGREATADNESITDSPRRKATEDNELRTDPIKREAAKDKGSKINFPRREVIKDKDPRIDPNQRELAKDKEHRTYSSRKEATTDKEPRTSSPRREESSDKTPRVISPRRKATTDEERRTDSLSGKATKDREPRLDSLENQGNTDKVLKTYFPCREATKDTEPTTDSIKRESTNGKETRTNYQRRNVTTDKEPKTEPSRREATRNKEPSTDFHEIGTTKDKEPRNHSPRREATTDIESRIESARRVATTDEHPRTDSHERESTKGKESRTDSPSRPATKDNLPRTDCSRREATTDQEPRKDSSKTEKTRDLGPRKDSPERQSDTDKALKTDFSRREKTTNKEPRTNYPKTEATENREPRTDSPTKETTTDKVPRIDSQRRKATTDEEPRTDFHEIEATTDEIPITVSPRREATKDKEPSLDFLRGKVTMDEHPRADSPKTEKTLDKESRIHFPRGEASTDKTPGTDPPGRKKEPRTGNIKKELFPNEESMSYFPSSKAKPLICLTETPSKERNYINDTPDRVMETSEIVPIHHSKTHLVSDIAIREPNIEKRQDQGIHTESPTVGGNVTPSPKYTKIGEEHRGNPLFDSSDRILDPVVEPLEIIPLHSFHNEQSKKPLAAGDAPAHSKLHSSSPIDKSIRQPLLKDMSLQNVPSNNFAGEERGSTPYFGETPLENEPKGVSSRERCNKKPLKAESVLRGGTIFSSTNDSANGVSPSPELSEGEKLGDCSPRNKSVSSPSSSDFPFGMEEQHSVPSEETKISSPLERRDRGASSSLSEGQSFRPYKSDKNRKLSPKTKVEHISRFPKDYSFRDPDSFDEIFPIHYNKTAECNQIDMPRMKVDTQSGDSGDVVANETMDLQNVPSLHGETDDLNTDSNIQPKSAACEDGRNFQNAVVPNQVTPNVENTPRADPEYDLGQHVPGDQKSAKPFQSDSNKSDSLKPTYDVNIVDNQQTPGLGSYPETNQMDDVSPISLHNDSISSPIDCETSKSDCIKSVEDNLKPSLFQSHQVKVSGEAANGLSDTGKEVNESKGTPLNEAGQYEARSPSPCAKVPRTTDTKDTKSQRKTTENQTSKNEQPTEIISHENRNTGDPNIAQIRQLPMIVFTAAYGGISTADKNPEDTAGENEKTKSDSVLDSITDSSEHIQAEADNESHSDARKSRSWRRPTNKQRRGRYPTTENNVPDDSLTKTYAGGADSRSTLDKRILGPKTKVNILESANEILSLKNNSFTQNPPPNIGDDIESIDSSTSPSSGHSEPRYPPIDLRQNLSSDYPFSTSSATSSPRIPRRNLSSGPIQRNALGRYSIPLFRGPPSTTDLSPHRKRDKRYDMFSRYWRKGDLLRPRVKGDYCVGPDPEYSRALSRYSSNYELRSLSTSGSNMAAPGISKSNLYNDFSSPVERRLKRKTESSSSVYSRTPSRSATDQTDRLSRYQKSGLSISSGLNKSFSTSQAGGFTPRSSRGAFSPGPRNVSFVSDF